LVNNTLCAHIKQMKSVQGYLFNKLTFKE